MRFRTLRQVFTETETGTPSRVQPRHRTCELGQQNCPQSYSHRLLNRLRLSHRPDLSHKLPSLPQLGIGFQIPLFQNPLDETGAM